MQTQSIRWYKNLIRWFVSVGVVSAFCLVATFAIFLLLGWGTAIKAKPEVIFPLSMVSPVIGLLLGTLIFYGEKKIRIFDYEKKNKLVPFIDNKSVIFVNKQDKDKIDWRENKEFNATIFPKSDGDYEYVFAYDSDGNNYCVPNKYFARYASQIINGGLSAKWTWSWTNSNMIVLLMVDKNANK